MIVVMQCAARKKPNAGHLRRLDGRAVTFVANPGVAPLGASRAYARPDDASDVGPSWRTVLREYNADPGHNPLGLIPAWQLYANRTYGLLAEHCGLARLYILSAGWGLIQADFLTPAYDITFSPNAGTYKRRGKKDRYEDFRMLPPNCTEPIIFFGGKDYVSLFCTLSQDAKAPRTVWYNSEKAPRAPGCVLRRFHTPLRTNWHYECAKAFIAGNLQLPSG